jgi:hyperosmotically inducible periplasmic protein
MTLRQLAILAAAGLLGSALSSSPLLYAQETASSAPPEAAAPAHQSAAGQELHQSGQAAKAAVSEAGHSIKHAYKATKYELSDAALTTKVKAALLTDDLTKHFAIDVDSNQGTVTLDGKVDSQATAMHAEAVTKTVNGVQWVKNDLTWPTS